MLQNIQNTVKEEQSVFVLHSTEKCKLEVFNGLLLNKLLDTHIVTGRVEPLPY